MPNFFLSWIVKYCWDSIGLKTSLEKLVPTPYPMDSANFGLIKNWLSSKCSYIFSNVYSARILLLLSFPYSIDLFNISVIFWSVGNWNNLILCVPDCVAHACAIQITIFDFRNKCNQRNITVEDARILVMIHSPGFSTLNAILYFDCSHPIQWNMLRRYIEIETKSVNDTVQTITNLQVWRHQISREIISKGGKRVHEIKRQNKTFF